MTTHQLPLSAESERPPLRRATRRACQEGASPRLQHPIIRWERGEQPCRACFPACPPCAAQPGSSCAHTQSAGVRYLVTLGLWRYLPATPSLKPAAKAQSCHTLHGHSRFAKVSRDALHQLCLAELRAKRHRSRAALHSLLSLPSSSPLVLKVSLSIAASVPSNVTVCRPIRLSQTS